MAGESMTLDELRALREKESKKKTKRVHHGREGVEQEHLMVWMRSHKNPAVRELASVVYAVPNGGTRNVIEAANMKRQGVRAGVSDLVVPVGRGGFFGMYLELKATPPHDAKLSESQKVWLGKMEANLYCAVLAIGIKEAKEAIEMYADLPSTEVRNFTGMDVMHRAGSDWRAKEVVKSKERFR